MTINLTPWLAGMDFGVGVNSLNGDFKGDAVQRTPPEPPLDQSTQDVTLEMRRIDTLDDLQESLNISVEADGRYGLMSGSARFDFAKNSHITDYSVYFLIKVTVSNSFQRMRDVTLKDGPRALLSQGRFQDFQNANGDCFVVGMQTGGAFFALLQFSSHSDEEKEKIAASLNFSFNELVASADVSASIDHQLQEKHIKQDLSIYLHVEGGDPAKPLPVKDDSKGAIDRMLEYARNFPIDVAKHGKPIGVSLMSYRSLDLPNPPNFVDIENQRQSLIVMMRERNADLTTLNKLDYILDANHQSEFDGLDANLIADLQAKRNALAERINAITHLASQCADDARQCQIPEALQPIAIGMLPARKADPITAFVDNQPGDRRDWFQTLAARRSAGTWQIQEYDSDAAGQAEGDRQGAAVYFDTQSKAIFEVHGDIYKKYKEMGAEQSPLGLPISNEEAWQTDDHGRQSRFQHGTITWLRANRQITVVPTVDFNVGVFKNVHFQTLPPAAQ